MARTLKKVFDGIFAQLEETDGNVVLFDAKGSSSVIFEMTNPVPRLCTDSERYTLFQDVLADIVQTLGEGYALQKQDIFCRQEYRHEVPDGAEFLTRSYFAYFEGREFTEITTYLIITQEAPKVARLPRQGVESRRHTYRERDPSPQALQAGGKRVHTPFHGLQFQARGFLHDQLQGFRRISQDG